MSEVPQLNADELRQELARIHKVRRRSLTTAIAARGPRTTIRLRIDGGEERELDTVPVRCELELRRALADKGERDLVLLVDYPAERFPADIAGRVAHGKLHRIDRSRRLALLFRAQAASAELLARRELCKALLEEQPKVQESSPGPTVDLKTAVRALLWHKAGIDKSMELTEPSLLAHIVTHEPSAKSQELAPSSLLGGEVALLLRDLVGELAPTFLAAWIAGKARKVAAMCFVLQACHDKLDDAGLRNAVLTALREVDPGLGSSALVASGFARRWGALADNLALRLHGDPRFDAVLQLADATIVDPELARSLASSKYLPSARAWAEAELAASLRACAEAPTIEAFDRGRSHYERLRAHTSSDRGAHRARLERAHMALRLVGYLLARPDLDAEAESYGSLGAVYALATHQTKQGGFVDHARARAAGELHSELDRAIEAVLQRVDAMRDADDLRFARSYAEWRTHGAHSQSPVRPIEQVVSDLVVGFLKDKPHRKLLVLLLDGMSWANAVELLLDLEDQHRHGVLRLPATYERPVLAAVPTLTGVSRAALFGGKLVPAGEPLATGRDPARFAEHPALARIELADCVLHLKDALEYTSGGLSRETAALVASEQRLVGVVVNALDDQLKLTRQIHSEATLQSIKPLRALLDAASSAGRAVLLVSDHGNVPGHRLRPVGKQGDGPRYRYLGHDEAVLEHEVVLSREVAYVPRGKQRVAMLARACDGYGSTPNVGEHGGLSLGEVVAPAVMLGADRLHETVLQLQGVDDPELQVRPLPQPEFWRLELPTALRRPRAPASLPPQPPVVAPPRAKPQQPSLPLFESSAPVNTPSGEQRGGASTPPTQGPAAAPNQAAASRVEPEPSASLTRLLRSKAFGKLDPGRRKAFEARIAPRIAALYDAGGKMSTVAFAQLAGILKHRVAGAVNELGEWVNFDQFLIVEFDEKGGRVTLDIGKLDAYLDEAT